ncbi:sulfite oxidase [Planotetraspora kaengkrachanensis]|uniref:Sulfite oxidase n=1 Tax=Planotetraspora kaengkrachanensis TaxID=575193 RepID=A0A8J3V9F9_9ACTN|nr:sulfite oxidase [Planotetraspora kaengkrachanensis]GIG82631.1 sulfite oxidase [Planotetraspora kaengkrachanensis]
MTEQHAATRTLITREVVKPTPAELMEDTGTGLDFGTRPDRMPGHVTPADRFFVRNHAPTPRLDAATWTLRIEGDGVRAPVSYTYDDLWRRFPMVSVVATLECAGNRRALFGEEAGARFEGTQWGRGAVGTAEWTGVRLRDLLEPAGVTSRACEVMPEGLDAARACRPLPLAKALADDTLVTVAMNGEILPPDHGFPARIVVSGWLGAASIKWVGRIEVAERPLRVPWNTRDYVLFGPGHPAEGTPITGVPVSALVELPWPARLRPGPQIVRGRAFAGERPVVAVDYRVDENEPWRPAVLTTPGSAGVWARWQFHWNPRPDDHVIRVRAIDDQGCSQPDSSAWNALGYCQNAVLAHPVMVG